MEKLIINMYRFKSIYSLVDKKNYFFNMISLDSGNPCLIFPIYTKNVLKYFITEFNETLSNINCVHICENESDLKKSFVKYDIEDLEFSYNNKNFSTFSEFPNYFFDKLFTFKNDLFRSIFPTVIIGDYFLQYNEDSIGGYIKAGLFAEFENFIEVDINNKSQFNNTEQLIINDYRVLGKDIIDTSLIINLYRRSLKHT